MIYFMRFSNTVHVAKKYDFQLKLELSSNSFVERYAGSSFAQNCKFFCFAVIVQCGVCVH